MPNEPLQVKPGTIIKARYARLPLMDLSERFLVQIIEPVPMVPVEKRVSIICDITHDKTPIEMLKQMLLDEWHDNLRGVNLASLPSWMISVDEVELTECDLLVPR